jgi:hypothetical protein
MGVPREDTIFEQASREVDNGLWAKLHFHPPYIRSGSHGQGSNPLGLVNEFSKPKKKKQSQKK